jgi:peptidoglycan/xylan/chitin deacetylase (PgdA/CDA1 family)
MAAALIAAIADAAGAAGKAPTPLRVTSSSLTQDGQRLVWKVEVDGRFSANGLAADHRLLCLEIERAKSGSVTGQICVVPGKHSARLVYEPITGKSARGVTATITRSGADGLTASFTTGRFDTSYSSVRWQVLSTVHARGCVPQAPHGDTCAVLYPRHPSLASLHVPKLVGCVPEGSDLVFTGPTNVHDIALSFDDGPWGTPPTMDFINLLAKYHVPATFFEIGDQISEFDPTGSVQRAMLANGDMIGDHTWTHPDMTSLSSASQRSELELTADAIRHDTGFTPCLWRPPYGDTNSSLESLARSLGMTTIMWDIDPRDWALPGVGEIEGNIIGNAHNGGITEMHFGGGPRYQTLDALPDIIDTLKARGYKFVTLTQMLGYRLIYK